MLLFQDSVKGELNRWLGANHSQADGTEYYIDYDIEAVPALAQDMNQVAEKLGAAHWLTQNEKREEMGYDPLDTPEADIPWIPSNLMPIEGSGMPLSEEMKRYAKYHANGNGVKQSKQ